MSENTVSEDIVDYNEKRKIALEEIDNAKLGWFHVRACLVSGVGFFTDAYDIFAVQYASAMLATVYVASDSKGKLPPNYDTPLKVATPLGNIIGQIAFGYLADRVGRKKMYGIELIMMIVATIGAALSANGYAINIFYELVFWRLILGIGIGGDYPLSSIITSEFASKKYRGGMIAGVFAMQGLGMLCSALVTLITVAAAQKAISASPDNVDYLWRIVFGVGAIPAMGALYFRLTIPETPRYTMDVERDVDQASKDITTVLRTGKYEDRDPTTPVNRVDAPESSWEDFWAYFGKWENGKVLLGTAVSWLAVDVAFYGIGLNNNIVLSAIGYASDKDPYILLRNAATGNVWLALMGAIPGYLFTVFLVDKWGRKTIQIMGFTCLIITFIVLGAAYDELKKIPALFIVIFSLTQFFQNFGPNTTTFIIPGEVFPTRYRSTGHGLSAASGKLGAIIGQFAFGALIDYGGTPGSNAFIGKLFIVFAAWMVIGLLFTLLLPETKGRSLEELSNERIILNNDNRTGRRESEIGDKNI